MRQASQKRFAGSRKFFAQCPNKSMEIKYLGKKIHSHCSSWHIKGIFLQPFWNFFDKGSKISSSKSENLRKTTYFLHENKIFRKYCSGHFDCTCSNTAGKNCQKRSVTLLLKIQKGLCKNIFLQTLWSRCFSGHVECSYDNTTESFLLEKLFIPHKIYKM